MPSTDSLPRVLFGDDVFISYSRADGATYAAALASELTLRGLSCRFDQWGAEPGRDVPRSILRAVRRSSMLIVVATAASGRSDAVAQEVRSFLPTRRLIIPIDLDGTIRQALWWPLLEGLAISIEESSDGGLASQPSAHTIDRIVNSITFTRRNRRLQWIALGTAFVVLGLLGAAAIAGQRAASAAAEAARQSEAARLAAGRVVQAEARVGAEQGKLAKQVELTAQATQLREAADRARMQSQRALKEQTVLTLEAQAARVRADRLQKAAEDEITQTVATLGQAREELKKQTDVSESGELARASLRLNSQDALDTAMRAVRTSPTPAAKEALERVVRSALEGRDRNTQAAADPQGRYVAIVSGYGDASLFDLKADREVVLCGDSSAVERLVFSPDGNYLLLSRSAGRQRVIRVWDTSKGALAGTVAAPGFDNATRYWFSPDGHRLLTIAFTQPLQVWELPSGRLVATINDVRGGTATNVLFDPEHRTFFAYQQGGLFREPAGIWNWESGEALWIQKDSRTRWATYRAPSTYLTWAEGPSIESRGGFEVLHLDSKGVPGKVDRFSIQSFDYSTLVGGTIGSLFLRESLGEVLAARFPRIVRCTTAPSVTTSRTEIYLCNDYSKPEPPVLIDVAAMRPLGALQSWTFGSFIEATFSVDDALLFVNGGVWDVKSRSLLWTLPKVDTGTAARFGQVRFSSDSRRLLANGRAYESRTGRELGKVRSGDPLYTDRTGNIIIGQDGREVFVWSVDMDKTVAVFDITTKGEEAHSQAIDRLRKEFSVEDLLRVAASERHACIE